MPVSAGGTTSSGPTGLPSLPRASDCVDTAAGGVLGGGVVAGRSAADPDVSTPPHASPSVRSLLMSPEGAGVTVTPESMPALLEVIVSLPDDCEAVAARPAFESAELSSVAICAGVLETSVVSDAKRTTSTAGPKSTERRSVFALALIVSGFATAAAPTEVPLADEVSGAGRL